MLHITLALAQTCNPCKEKLDIFLLARPKIGYNAKIPLDDVDAVLGIPDTLWCLRCGPNGEKARARKFGALYVRQTLIDVAPPNPWEVPFTLLVNGLRKYSEGDHGKPLLAEALKLWSDILSGQSLNTSQRIFVKACIVVCKFAEYNDTKISDTAYATRIVGEKISRLEGQAEVFEQQQKEFVTRMLQEV